MPKLLSISNGIIWTAKGIVYGEMISVKSRRGEVAVKARITRQVPQGLVWMAFHFREACANWLTNPVYDPVTQTAEYKACAVRIDKLKSMTLAENECNEV